LEIDGSKGYKEKAPYDKIICTAACPEIPEPWIKQLKESGIIVAPIGPEHQQQMIKAIKIKNKLEKEFLGYFVFVPLKGEYGFK
jgi:protein-L-isoaspartate(D-aspartate) O-methyltransferase